MKPVVILVADDEALNRKVLRELLTNKGFQVEEAVDGEAAVAKTRETMPELVLLDVRMPRLDGFEVCRILKHDERTQFIPIILITALSSVEDRVAGNEAGADEFLSKPFYQAELLTRVRSLIRLKQLIEQLERTENILFTMAALVEAKDPYTEGHLRRLEKYAGETAAVLGLSIRQSTIIKYGALLHDIGKIGVPEAILHKPGPLTPEEVEIIQQHPAIGERICRGLRDGAEIGPIVRGHHERWDGMGYPDRLAGEAIPLGARIIAVVDAFDAMTTDRPYRKALPSTEAWETLRHGAGSQWDSAVIEAFGRSQSSLAVGQETSLRRAPDM